MTSLQQLSNLTNEETNLLLKAPALISVLAASTNNEISDLEKADAIKLADLKTFTAEPILQDYYKEVDMNFESNFEGVVNKYSPFDEAKRDALKVEVAHIYTTIEKLDEAFATALKKSLSTYAAHVKKTDRNFVENFLFPFMN